MVPSGRYGRCSSVHFPSHTSSFAPNLSLDLSPDLLHHECFPSTCYVHPEPCYTRSLSNFDSRANTSLQVGSLFDSHLQALSMHSTQCSITILLVSWSMARLSLWVYGILLVKRITIVSAHSLTPKPMCSWFVSRLSALRVMRT